MTTEDAITAMSANVTLPISYLHMVFSEDERIGPRTKKDLTPHWWGQQYDEGYVLRGRPATDEEIAADATLATALRAYEESLYG